MTKEGKGSKAFEVVIAIILGGGFGYVVAKGLGVDDEFVPFFMMGAAFVSYALDNKR